MKKLICRIILISRFVRYKISDKLYKNKIKKLKFKQNENQEIGSGYNTKKLITDFEDKKWVIKFCRNTGGKVPDICEREELTYLFGRLFKIPMVHPVVLGSEILTCSVALGKDYIQSKFVLMPYIDGENIESIVDDEPKLKILRHHSKTLINAMAFYHWLGDEDRGLTDVMISNNKVLFIDHGLTGPGHDSNKRLRSAHPFPNDYNEKAVIKKCYPEKKSFTDFVFKDMGISLKDHFQPSIISFIEALPKFIFSSYINSFELLDPEDNNFREKYKAILIYRQKRIKYDFQKWIENYKKIKK